MSCSYAEAECIDLADLTDLTDLVDLNAERREFGRLRRREERESLCARMGGGGNIGVWSKVAGWVTLGVAHERWRCSSSVRSDVMSESRI